MAYYTDKPLQFTPYIQQLPVDAMVKVGMEKQRRYEEGIQRIQTQIDNVAGLDVARDVDRQYLQSSLNQLGTKLKTISAADFSNFQLVNSTAGMAAKIAKDPVIQNAVSSTARYRKGLSEMEAANKAGKGSPSNDWDFMNNANKWLNNPDVNSSFSGSYSPYTNYKKNALEVIKALTKDSTITDDAFTVDSKGNIVVADAIVRKKLEGISPEKIQQALMANLTPADFKQMEIDGRYTYSNVDPDTFIASIDNSHKEQHETFNKQRTALQSSLSQTNSAVERAKINEQIATLDKQLAKIDSEYKNISNSFAVGDVESAKARLHTSNFMNNFASAFSYTQTSQTYENNPLAEMQYKRDVKDQDWKKFILQQEQAERHFQLNYAQKQEALELKKKAAGGGVSGGLPVDIPQDQLPKYTLDRVKSEVIAGEQQIATEDFNFMSQNNKDQQWLDNQYKAWVERPGGVDPLVARHFQSTEAKRRQIAADKTMITQINKQAIDKFGDIYSKLPAGSPSVTVEDSTYSPKDIVEFNDKINNYIKVGVSGSTGGGGTSMSYFDDAAKAELTPKDYKFYEIYKKYNKGQKLSPSEKALMDAALHYNETVNVPYQSTLQDINKYVSEEVTKRLVTSQGVEYSIPTSNQALKDVAAGNLLKFATKADALGGKLANSPDWDSKRAREIATDPQAKYTIRVVEGTQIQPAMYEVTATGGKGESVKWRVTPEEKRAVWGNEYEASPAVQAIRPYQEQIKKMGGYSTAIEPGESNASNAYLNKIDFPAVARFGVSGNIVTPDGGRSYSIRLNIYDPIEGKWHENIPYPRTGLISEDKIAEAMARLDDNAAYELIHEVAPTQADLTRVQEASKRPK